MARRAFVRVKNLRADRDIYVLVGDTGQGIDLSTGDAWDLPWLDWDVVVRRQTQHDLVQDFLRRRRRGYLVFEGVASVGKSTLLADLARAHNWPSHFFRRGAGGASGAARAARSLVDQLAERYGLNRSRARLLMGSPDPTRALLTALAECAEAASGREPVVIVVDAIDDAGTSVGQTFLDLPRDLPTGVYIVASQRPGRQLLAVADVEFCRLDQVSAENRSALRKYLDTVLQRQAPELLARSPNVVDLLERKVQGLWLHADYLVRDLVEGRTDVDSLDRLPDGLWRYYADAWSRWQSDAQAWQDLYLPLSAAFGALPGPFTLELVDTLVGLPQRDAAERLLRESWRPFFRFDPSTGTVIPVHQSVVSFLSGAEAPPVLSTAEEDLVLELRSTARQFHARVVDRLIGAWGPLEDGFPALAERARTGELTKVDAHGLRRLAHHLLGSGSADLLHDLVTRPAERDLAGIRRRCSMWFEIKDHVGEVEDYLDDLALAAGAVDGLDAADALAAQLQCAVMATSVVGVAAKLPTAMFSELVRRGLWTVQQALHYARRIPELEEQAHTLLSLAQHGDDHLRDDMLREVEDLAAEVEWAERRAQVYLHLLMCARSTTDEDRLLPLLRACAAETSEQRALEIDLVVFPLLSEDDQRRTVRAAKARFREADEDERGDRLLDLLPLLSSQSVEGWTEVRDLVRSTSNHMVRTRCLAVLARCAQNAGERPSLADEALRSARLLTSDEWAPWQRAIALVEAAGAHDKSTEDTLGEAERLLDQPDTSYEPDEVVAARADLPPETQEFMAAMMGASARDPRYHASRTWCRLAERRPEHAARYAGKALAAADAVDQREWRPDALTFVARCRALPLGIRQEAARRAVHSAELARSQGALESYVSAVASELTDEDFADAIAKLRRLGDWSLVTHSAAMLVTAAAAQARAPQQARALTRAAERILKRSTSSYGWDEVLPRMAQHADPTLFYRVVEAALRIVPEGPRCVTVAKLTDRMNLAWLRKLRERLNSVQDPGFRVLTQALADARAASLGGIPAAVGGPEGDRDPVANVLEQLANAPVHGFRFRVGGDFLDDGPDPNAMFPLLVDALLNLRWEHHTAELLKAIAQRENDRVCGQALVAVARRASPVTLLEVVGTAWEVAPDAVADVLRVVVRRPDSYDLEALTGLILKQDDPEAVLPALEVIVPVLPPRALDRIVSLVTRDLKTVPELVAVLPMVRERLLELDALRLAEEIDRLVRRHLRQLWRSGDLSVAAASVRALRPSLRRRAAERKLLRIARRLGQADPEVPLVLLKWLPDRREDLEALTIAALESSEDKNEACMSIASALHEVRNPGRRAALEALADLVLCDAAPDHRFHLLATLLEVSDAEGRWPHWLDLALSTAREPGFGQGLPPNRVHAYGLLGSRVPASAKEAIGLLGRELQSSVGQPRSHLLRYLASQAELYAKALPGEAVERLAERLVEAAAMWP